MTSHRSLPLDDLAAINPLDPRHQQDPYPVYTRLREAGRVVHLDAMGMFVVSGFDETNTVLKQHELFSSAAFPMGGANGLGRSMIFADPPDHTRLRGVVSKAFTPRTVADLEGRVREIAAGLVATLRDGEPWDVVSELAIPLPVTVIAEMLGVDAAHRDDFKRWSDQIVGFGGAGLMGGTTVDAGFTDYFTEAIARRRTSPGDDLISRLVAANTDGSLTDDELMSTVVLLLVAGNETTTNLVSLATLNLARHPDERRRLADDRSLIPNAVEEILRYDSPVHFIPPRVAVRDIEVGGVTIPAGRPAITLLAGANRDPARFEDPDRLDVTRRDAAANVAFGSGVHYCLGAPLARLEGRIALELLLARAPSYALADATGPVDFHPSMFLRAIRRLEIVA